MHSFLVTVPTITFLLVVNLCKLPVPAAVYVKILFGLKILDLLVTRPTISFSIFNTYNSEREDRLP